jgi:hypothetical protein
MDIDATWNHWLKHHDASHHCFRKLLKSPSLIGLRISSPPMGQWDDRFHVSANKAIRMVRMPHGNGGQKDDMQLTTDKLHQRGDSLLILSVRKSV